MQRLHIDTPGACYCHFSSDRDVEYFEQLTSEVVRTRLVKGRPVREWHLRKEGMRNEALDCRVYAFAALRGLMQNYNLKLNTFADSVEGVKMKKEAEEITTNKSTATKPNITTPSQKNTTTNNPHPSTNTKKGRRVRGRLM